MSRAVTRKEAESRASSPLLDVDDEAPKSTKSKKSKKDKEKEKKSLQQIDEEEEEEVEEEEFRLPDSLGDSAAEALSFKIRSAASLILKQTGKFATNEQIAERIGEDVGTIAANKRQLKLARQGARLSGLRKTALKAGFSRRQGASRAEVQGRDMEMALLAPGDVLRCSRAFPLTLDKSSYSPEELDMRFELLEEKLPVGASREVIAAIEPVMRSLMVQAVERQSRLRTSRVTASTMRAVLKPFEGLCAFTAVAPPRGLVRYGKETGVDFVKRGDPESGFLMGTTDEDKKGYKAEKKALKEITALHKAATEAVVAAQEEKEAAKKKNKKVVAGKKGTKREAEPAPVEAKSKKARK